MSRGLILSSLTSPASTSSTGMPSESTTACLPSQGSFLPSSPAALQTPRLQRCFGPQDRQCWSRSPQTCGSRARASRRVGSRSVRPLHHHHHRLPLRQAHRPAVPPRSPCLCLEQTQPLLASATDVVSCSSKRFPQTCRLKSSRSLRSSGRQSPGWRAWTAIASCSATCPRGALGAWMCGFSFLFRSARHSTSCFAHWNMTQRLCSRGCQQTLRIRCAAAPGRP
mmetsp:Transcript_26006/g.88979  ORF Transcript_26006/g.88979 Transcript_26006/m.88979 type:complete len:224 (-) Transcript_26006:1170-1841(-)